MTHHPTAVPPISVRYIIRRALCELAKIQPKIQLCAGEEGGTVGQNTVQSAFGQPFGSKIIHPFKGEHRNPAAMYSQSILIFVAISVWLISGMKR